MKKQVLKDIYKENKAINRNVQTLITISYITLLWNVLKNAKKNGEDKAMRIGKWAFVLIWIRQMMLIFSDISDMRKKRKEQKSEK